MIAKIGQSVPKAVENKPANEASNVDKTFENMLHKAKQESKKPSKATKDNSKVTTDKDAKCEETATETMQAGENAVVESQPVQVEAIELDVVAELSDVQTANVEAETVTSVEVKVSNMQDQVLEATQLADEQTQTQPLLINQQSKETENNVPMVAESQIQNVEAEKKQSTVETMKTVTPSKQTEVETQTATKAESVKVNTENVTKQSETEQPKNLEVSNQTFKVETKQTKTSTKTEETQANSQFAPVAANKPHNEVVTKIVDKFVPNADTQTKEVISQVLSKIQANFKEIGQEFSFNLHPKELGKVAVKMAVKEGLLVVEIAASNAKAQSILAKNANEIRSILQSQLSDQQTQFVDASQNAQSSDYLQQEKQNNQNANQGQENNNSQNSDDSNETSTEDFLSVMKMVSQFEI